MIRWSLGFTYTYIKKQHLTDVKWWVRNCIIKLSHYVIQYKQGPFTLRVSNFTYILIYIRRLFLFFALEQRLNRNIIIFHIKITFVKFAYHAKHSISYVSFVLVTVLFRDNILRTIILFINYVLKTILFSNLIADALMCDVTEKRSRLKSLLWFHAKSNWQRISPYNTET